MSSILKRRISALEMAGPIALSPSIKAWLGEPLTESERLALERLSSHRAVVAIPPECQQWLVERGIGF